MVDKVFVAPRGRKYVGIPWKTKRKNQESRGDAICCAWYEMKVFPKKQPNVTSAQNIILIREVKQRIG